MDANRPISVVTSVYLLLPSGSWLNPLLPRASCNTSIHTSFPSWNEDWVEDSSPSCNTSLHLVVTTLPHTTSRLAAPHVLATCSSLQTLPAPSYHDRPPSCLFALVTFILHTRYMPYLARRQPPHDTVQQSFPIASVIACFPHAEPSFATPMLAQARPTPSTCIQPCEASRGGDK